MIFGPRHEVETTLRSRRDTTLLIGLHLAVYAMFVLVLPPSAMLLPLLLGATLIAISVIDCQRYEIPDTLSFTAALLGALSLLELPKPEQIEHGLTGFGLSLLLYLVARGYFEFRGQDGLGLGDVKLAFGLGLCLGFEGSVFLLLSASLSAIGTLICVGLIRKVPLNKLQVSGLAFAPFLCLSAWVMFLQERAAW